MAENSKTPGSPAPYTSAVSTCTHAPPKAALPQRTLKVVPTPLVEAPSAPPALEDRKPTVNYVCGSCGAVLMHADENRVHPLIIYCTVCDACNSTDAEPPWS